MNKLIPIAKPQILKSDIKLSTQAIKRGWNEKHLYYVNKFENDFKSKTPRGRHALRLQQIFRLSYSPGTRLRIDFISQRCCKETF